MSDTMDQPPGTHAAATPPSARPLLVALAATLGCILLMELPWLDPATLRGSRNFGLAFTLMLCSGLLLWALGVVRRHRSQFRLRTVLLGTTLVAAFLAAVRAMPPFIPAMTAMALCSLGMLYDSVRAPSAPAAFRSRPSRVVICLAGALGLAHVIRFVVHGLLQR